MCGIAGFLSPTKGWHARELTDISHAMGSAVLSRGPDAGGDWVSEQLGLGLAHRRLSIVDLSPTGAQPMLSADGDLVITFNGEIYNFQAIRAELEGLGHRFRGTSDTEVLLGAIQEWGIVRALQRTVGMFALGVLDLGSRVLWLARDRMGEKPLYYGWAGSSFLFGSTPKALIAHPDWQGQIDPVALDQFLRLQYVPSPYSIYKGIKKLPPGCTLKLSLLDLVPGRLPEPEPYWNLREVAERGMADPIDLDDVGAVDELERLLKQSLNGQMFAERPLGAFLSGGIDSSAVVGLMQSLSSKRVKTFTIGFEQGSLNEAPYAAKVANHLGTEHSEWIVTAEDARSIIPSLPEIYDEPFADQSQIPTCLLAAFARKQVTVSLSGDGGDELFCGYNRHVQLEKIWSRVGGVSPVVRGTLAAGLENLPEAITKNLVRKFGGNDQLQVAKLCRVLRSASPLDAYQALLSSMEGPVLGSSLATDREQWPLWSDYLDTILYVESASSLPDKMLVKLDRAAMAVGLETRVPILDHRIVEFSWRLPRRMKLRDGSGKWILRRVLDRYVPSDLVERPKAGFQPPVREWLLGPLRAWAGDLLSSQNLDLSGMTDGEPIQAQWDQFLSGKRHSPDGLWAVLMFQAWMARWKP